MLVKVRFSDGTCGTVDSSAIAKRIEDGEIREIRRTSGWVRIDSDEARKHQEDEARTERRRVGSLINIYV